VLAGVDDLELEAVGTGLSARTMGAIFMKLGRAPATR